MKKYKIGFEYRVYGEITFEHEDEITKENAENYVTFFDLIDIDVEVLT